MALSLEELEEALTWSLHRAIEEERNDILDFLLSSGKDVFDTDVYGRTALHVAVEKNSMKAVELLVHDGVELDRQRKNGNTALHEAIMLAHDDIALYLIENGADWKIPDQENRACLELAEQKERPRIVEKIKSIIEEGEKKADSDYQQLQQSQWQRIVALKTESGSPTKR